VSRTGVCDCCTVRGLTNKHNQKRGWIYNQVFDGTSIQEGFHK
jgi:hypothetical protein